MWKKRFLADHEREKNPNAACKYDQYAKPAIPAQTPPLIDITKVEPKANGTQQNHGHWANGNLASSALPNSPAFQRGPAPRQTAHPPSRKQQEQQQSVANTTNPTASPTDSDENRSSDESSEHVPKFNARGEQLYCLCLKPYNPRAFMIGCDECNDWFHGRCVRVPQAVAKSLDSFICPRCTRRRARKEGEKSGKKRSANKSGGGASKRARKGNGRKPAEDAKQPAPVSTRQTANNNEPTASPTTPTSTGPPNEQLPHKPLLSQALNGETPSPRKTQPKQPAPPTSKLELSSQEEHAEHQTSLVLRRQTIESRMLAQSPVQGATKKHPNPTPLSPAIDSSLITAAELSLATLEAPPASNNNNNTVPLEEGVTRGTSAKPHFVPPAAPVSNTNSSSRTVLPDLPLTPEEARKQKAVSHKNVNGETRRQPGNPRDTSTSPHAKKPALVPSVPVLELCPGDKKRPTPSSAPNKGACANTECDKLVYGNGRFCGDGCRRAMARARMLRRQQLLTSPDTFAPHSPLNSGSALSSPLINPSLSTTTTSTGLSPKCESVAAGDAGQKGLVAAVDRLRELQNLRSVALSQIAKLKQREEGLNAAVQRATETVGVCGFPVNEPERKFCSAKSEECTLHGQWQSLERSAIIQDRITQENVLKRLKVEEDLLRSQQHGDHAASTTRRPRSPSLSSTQLTEPIVPARTTQAPSSTIGA